MLWPGFDVIDQLFNEAFPINTTLLIKPLQKPNHLLCIFGKRQITFHDFTILHHGIPCSFVAKLAVMEFAVVKRVAVKIDNLLAEFLTLKVHELNSTFLAVTADIVAGIVHRNL